jgi:pSer/pThr/pTyr-binding forkhead associated (FHA) protein
MSEDYGHDTISAPVRSPIVGGAVPLPPVVALRDRDSGERFDLSFETRNWTVGKSPHADLLIKDDPYVSNAHCVLERRAGGVLVIRDAESKNGTFVDGTPVLALELRPGAVVQLGRTFLVAMGAGQPASAVAQLRGRDPRFRAAVDLAPRAATAAS